MLSSRAGPVAIARQILYGFQHVRWDPSQRTTEPPGLVAQGRCGWVVGSGLPACSAGSTGGLLGLLPVEPGGLEVVELLLEGGVYTVVHRGVVGEQSSDLPGLLRGVELDPAHGARVAPTGGPERRRQGPYG